MDDMGRNLQLMVRCPVHRDTPSLDVYNFVSHVRQTVCAPGIKCLRAAARGFLLHISETGGDLGKAAMENSPQ